MEKTRKMVSKSLWLLLVMIGLIGGFPSVNLAEEATDLKQPSGVSSIIEENYRDIYPRWQKELGDSVNQTYTVAPTSFTSESQAPLQLVESKLAYPSLVAELTDTQSIFVEVEVAEAGLYTLAFDHLRTNSGIINPEFGLKVNGEYPFYESRRIIAPTQWKNSQDTYPVNGSGNELIPEQVEVQAWQKSYAQDASYLEKEPLQFKLNAGKNKLEFIQVAGSLYLGEISLQGRQKLVGYADYLDGQQGEVDQTTKTSATTVQAETFSWKNNSYIRPVSKRDINVTPYESKKIVFNTLGGESWQKSGQGVSWEFEVEEAGFYQFSFKTKQDTKANAPVFRQVLIDQALLFDELAHYTFPPSNKWIYHTLGNNEENYSIYLTPGTHELSLTADAAPIASVAHGLQSLMLEISDLGLELKKITGGEPDQSRDWRIEEYIPDIVPRLTAWEEKIKEFKEDLTAVYGEAADESTEMVSISIVSDKLAKLKAEPDKIPLRLNELSEGSSSVSQMLGDIRAELEKQPLLLDEIIIHSESYALPSAEVSTFKKVTSKIKEFASSFTADTVEAGKSTDADTLKVWVARSQQHVELLQNMADSTFTAETGRKVEFSVMPSEQKLILANSGGQQPDVAMGVTINAPYDLAIRGAAANLSEFPDFKQYIDKFSPGAFMPFMIDDQVYALPETQDFYVMFYRKDMLEKLNIPIPKSWDEVTAILPELQRYGLNFYIPLSSSAGTKAFMFTAPFIYQFEGDLFTEDGMATAIDSEKSLKGLNFMTDLYTLYGLPLQVPSFYNSFRYGTLPIGVSNFENYIKLTAAAPEIAGSWELALYPGVKQADGSINRDATGSANSAMIFEKSDKKDDAWELLKWWMSTETQSAYAINLQTIYGEEYMWNSANLEAFKELPWPEEHKAVILEQWKSLKEVPKTPGSYMLEREISNIWTEKVFHDANLRSTVDDSKVIIDREIKRKMEEFGYLKDGQQIKEFIVPKVETVEGWTDNEGKK